MIDPAKAVKDAREEFRRLWEVEGALRPGPKSTQSARTIARAAIAIADAEGLQAVSMRQIAGSLSISAMALYNHVPGKAELLSIMIDEVASEMLEPTSGDWHGRATCIAWTNWQCLMRHPWLLSVESHRPVIGPNVLRKYDQELAAFDHLGLSNIEMDFALNSLLGLVRGCASTQIDANGVLKKRDQTDMEWWQVRQPLLEQLDIEHRFPLASKVGAAIGAHSSAPQSPEESFRFGLDRWLEGMAALIAARAPGGVNLRD